MRILAITDLHGSGSALERILAHAGPTDAILLGGDLTHFGSPADAERVIEAAEASGARVLAVTGNCDSPAIEERLVQWGVSLHQRGVVLETIGWHGVSAIPHWRAGMHQFSEEELAAALEAGYAQVTGARHHCLLAHVPPHGLSLDEVYSGRHVGSTALRTFVEQKQPCVVICGHIHETRGLELLGRTKVVNCGYGAAGNYALIEAGNEVAVDLRCA